MPNFFGLGFSESRLIGSEIIIEKKRILVFWGSSEFQEIPTQDTETGQVPKPLNRMMKRQFWDAVGRFSQRLSRKEREVFMLRFLDQLGIREIAQVMKKSESTVKTHLYRAIAKFKEDRELTKLIREEAP